MFKALACGPVKSTPDGVVEEVVAVGGYNGEVELGEYLSVVEIYNFVQATWRAGKYTVFFSLCNCKPRCVVMTIRMIR